MRQDKLENACVGDFIITNELFIVTVNGVKKVKSGLPGVIVHKNSVGAFGIRFGEGHAWTLNISNMLSGETGYYLKREQFDLDNE